MIALSHPTAALGTDAVSRLPWQDVAPHSVCASGPAAEAIVVEQVSIKDLCRREGAFLPSHVVPGFHPGEYFDPLDPGCCRFLLNELHYLADEGCTLLDIDTPPEVLRNVAQYFAAEFDVGRLDRVDPATLDDDPGLAESYPFFARCGWRLNGIPVVDPSAVSPDGRLWLHDGVCGDVVDAFRFLHPDCRDRAAAVLALAREFLPCGYYVVVRDPDGDEFDLLVPWRENVVAEKWNGRLLVASLWLREDPPPPEPVLEGLLDCGLKLLITGDSKARKSFFALQLAVSLAAGLERFLAWRIPKPLRVLVAQLEIPPAHYHARLRSMSAALGVEPADLADRLLVYNGRGDAGLMDNDAQRLIALAKDARAQFVLLDPLYKLASGDENAAKDMKPTLAAFDRLAVATGAALAYLHHHGKGTSGDRAAIDRGAGSGILARDHDAALHLTPHKVTGLLVCDPIARCYAPTPAFSLGWDERRGLFTMRDDPPCVLTSAGGGKQVPPTGVANVVGAVSQVGGRMPRSVLQETLRRGGVPVRAARAVIDEAVTSGAILSERAFGGPTLLVVPGTGVRQL